MKIPEDKETPNEMDEKPVSGDSGAIVRDLLAHSGNQILDRILEQENPLELVQQISQQDFYWLVKKVGEDDCLPLLKMASDDQRQYLLDLEFWNKDRLNMDKASEWLGRLHLADPKGFAEWFFSKGESLAYYYLHKHIHVEVKNEDEILDAGERLFTLEGVYYVRILDEEHRETIENILRSMASVDLDRYHAVLLTLAGVNPAEMEEDMYRMKNIRLAEHGFLPAEEAFAVYAPLKPATLNTERGPRALALPPFEEIRGLIPISPLNYAQGKNILTRVLSRINDNLFMDRLRLEFAGLCNQIVSADGMQVNELGTILKTCRKAGGYLNLTLEKMCEEDISLAEKLLKNNTLVSLFRVGFGFALGLKWETERWLKKSWFYEQDLPFGFWGDEWGETLAGIVKRKPQLYVGYYEEEEYKDFERLSEIDDCRKLVRRLVVLDKMLERLTAHYPLDDSVRDDNQLTFHQLVFNLWARRLLNLKPCFLGITDDQVKDFFRVLRNGEEAPPYRMLKYKEVFIRDFMGYVPDIESEFDEVLKDSLLLIWQEFCQEYEWIFTDDLEGRFTKFIATI